MLIYWDSACFDFFICNAILVDTGMTWYVYIILCTDDTLYTGITTDINKRWLKHCSQKGAKYFRGREPKDFVYIETGHDRSSASKRESIIKKMTRGDKFHLIKSDSNQLKNVVIHR